MHDVIILSEVFKLMGAEEIIDKEITGVMSIRSKPSFPTKPQKILSIPLSYQPSQNSMIWKWTNVLS